MVVVEKVVKNVEVEAELTVVIPGEMFVLKADMMVMVEMVMVHEEMAVGVVVEEEEVVVVEEEGMMVVEDTNNHYHSSLN